MFSKIERAYQKGLSEKRFWDYYRPRAVVAIVLAVVVVMIFHFEVWLVSLAVAAVLFVLVGIFFFRDMRAVIGQVKVPKGWRSYLRVYAERDEQYRLNLLLGELEKYHIHTPEDLKLAIDYYSHSRPVTTRTGLLEWVLSITIALASVVAFAYDDQIGAINELKLVNVVLPTIWIVLIIIVPIIIIGFAVGKIFFSHSKVDDILVEDLAYLYVNFDEYFENH